jgi:SAM-dependent methyltransferase
LGAFSTAASTNDGNWLLRHQRKVVFPCHRERGHVLAARQVSAAPGRWRNDSGCGLWLRPGCESIQRSWPPRGGVSAKLAGLAAAYLQQDVPTKSFLDVDEVAVYDGIWACASLLHVAETDQPRAWAGLWRALKPGGVVYASYKLADGPQANERLDELGRPFTDATEARVARWLQGLRDVAGVDTWVTGDLRPGQAQAWLNVLAHRR